MNKSLNVVYMGGSITEGAGASSCEKSFGKIVSNFLKGEYLHGQVNIFNAGASGTASDFGLFRLQRDVISKKPDLVFIEFAVNDRIKSSSDVCIYMEGIIRNLLRLPKVPQIILLIAPTEMSDACGDVHRKIAYYYNIPIIDIQDYIWREIGKGKFSWNDISIDSLHPNDLGHKLYGECIIKVIKDERLLEENQSKYKENPLMNFQFASPQIRSYEEAIFYGHWREENFNLKKRIEMAAVSDTPGDCMEIKFKGRYIGVTTLLASDCGIMDINLDGINGSLDLFLDSDNYFTTAINKGNLSDTEHSLIISVSDKRNPKSNGHKIIIGGFLVEK